MKTVARLMTRLLSGLPLPGGLGQNPGGLAPGMKD
jgi:hypothetical protein